MTGSLHWTYSNPHQVGSIILGAKTTNHIEMKTAQLATKFQLSSKKWKNKNVGSLNQIHEDHIHVLYI